MSDEGGDAACWADRVCAACGRLDERDRRDGRCPHCAAPVDAQDDLTDADYERLLHLRDGLRRFLHWSELQAQRAGITAAQHQLLLAVRGHRPGPPTLGDLSAHLLLRHHSAVGLVDRAETAGLVRRTRDEVDHRVVRVALTGRGADVLAGLTAAHKAELERTGLGYGALGEGLPGD